MGQDVMQVTGQARALASAASRSLASPAAASCASSASAWLAPLQADGRELRDHEEETEGGQDGQAGGRRDRGVEASSMATAATTGMLASSATRGDVRRARPTSAM